MNPRRLSLLLVCLAVSAGPAFGATPQPSLADIRLAIDEQRYIDAERGIETLVLQGGNTPELAVLSGDLNLAENRFGDALAAYRAGESGPQTRLAALEGEGIALLQLGRPDDAVPRLNIVVRERPAAWRSWNALGVIHDQRGEWAAAMDAFGHAAASSDGDASVLNNRGFSLLLQNCPAAAAADFTAALRRRPGLKVARANLETATARAAGTDPSGCPAIDRDEAGAARPEPDRP